MHRLTRYLVDGRGLPVGVAPPCGFKNDRPTMNSSQRRHHAGTRRVGRAVLGVVVLTSVASVSAQQAAHVDAAQRIEVRSVRGVGLRAAAALERHATLGDPWLDSRPRNVRAAIPEPFGRPVRRAWLGATAQPPPAVGERSTRRKVFGAIVGGVGGFFGGLFLGAAIEGDRCNCDDPGLVGALVGAPVGGVVGSVLGYKYLF
jgi:hypothetical protein